MAGATAGKGYSRELLRMCYAARKDDTSKGKRRVTKKPAKTVIHQRVRRFIGLARSKKGPGGPPSCTTRNQRKAPQASTREGFLCTPPHSPARGMWPQSGKQHHTCCPPPARKSDQHSP
eukprot:1188029-Prorocentrum_minimum.AAC.3